MKRARLAFLVAFCISSMSCGTLIERSFTHRVQGQYFDSNGVRIHYTVDGQGEPVILVHGFAANADANWRAPGIIKALAKDYQVIAFDNRGHGLSDKPHDPAAYGKEMCNDIVRMMDHLHIQKAHVVGYSMGGFITYKFLTMYPERLLSAAPCGAGWERDGEDSALREEIAASLDRGEGFLPQFKALAPEGKKVPSRLAKRFDQVLTKVNDEKALAAAMRGMDNLRVTEEQLRANKVPTLTIIGADDPLRKGVDPMKGVMANQEIVYLKRRDHTTALPDPKFLKTLRAFIKRHSLSVQGTTAAA